MLPVETVYLTGEAKGWKIGEMMAEVEDALEPMGLKPLRSSRCEKGWVVLAWRDGEEVDDGTS
jgi:hypothetical protein